MSPESCTIFFIHSLIHIRLIVTKCQNATLHENGKQYSKSNTANIKFTAEAADKTCTYNVHYEYIINTWITVFMAKSTIFRQFFTFVICVTYRIIKSTDLYADGAPLVNYRVLYCFVCFVLFYRRILCVLHAPRCLSICLVVCPRSKRKTASAIHQIR